MVRVLLIVGGGIAAYKSLELVRLLKKAGHEVTPVLTKGGEHFVTAMSLGTLAESQVHSSLWELKDEVEIGHIQLSRAADFVLVCPATADLLAKMAAGKPVVVAPAMNIRMWLHAATQRNIAQLKADGVRVIDPAEGEMACGEFGPGRLPEPQEIMDRLPDLLK
jgi:phosphopantothenoylcysteine decarboxylase/phosphopantothenate--cysteine ligase